MSRTIDMQSAQRRDSYRILSSLVVPRPIAWVLTLGAAGTPNLAPFSSFMGIFSPPALAVTFGRRRDGSLKDTHRNLRERREAVVHIADASLLEALHASGEEVATEVSELVRLGLATLPSDVVSPPRLAGVPTALECRLREEHPMDNSSDLVVLDVLRAHVDERIWNDELGCADAERWEPVCRLVGGVNNGPNYALLGRRITLGTSKLPSEKA
ncbi:MAG: flavin reductase family protein [Acidobacteriota bacterium]